MPSSIEAMPSQNKLTFGQVPRHGLHQRSEAGDSSNRHGGDGGSVVEMKTMQRLSPRDVLESGIDAVCVRYLELPSFGERFGMR